MRALSVTPGLSISPLLTKLVHVWWAQKGQARKPAFCLFPHDQSGSLKRRGRPFEFPAPLPSDPDA